MPATSIIYTDGRYQRPTRLFSTIEIVNRNTHTHSTCHGATQTKKRTQSTTPKMYTRNNLKEVLPTKAQKTNKASTIVFQLQVHQRGLIAETIEGARVPGPVNSNPPAPSSRSLPSMATTEVANPEGIGFTEKRAFLASMAPFAGELRQK